MTLKSRPWQDFLTSRTTFDWNMEIRLQDYPAKAAPLLQDYRAKGSLFPTQTIFQQCAIFVGQITQINHRFALFDSPIWR